MPIRQTPESYCDWGVTQSEYFLSSGGRKQHVPQPRSQSLSSSRFPGA